MVNSLRKPYKTFFTSWEEWEHNASISLKRMKRNERKTILTAYLSKKKKKKQTNKQKQKRVRRGRIKKKNPTHKHTFPNQSWKSNHPYWQLHHLAGSLSLPVRPLELEPTKRWRQPLALCWCSWVGVAWRSRLTRTTDSRGMALKLLRSLRWNLFFSFVLLPIFFFFFFLKTLPYLHKTLSPDKTFVQCSSSMKRRALCLLSIVIAFIIFCQA